MIRLTGPTEELNQMATPIWGGNDDEPDLGSVESVGQSQWSAGAIGREAKHDGSEPSLCGLTAETTQCNSDDLEPISARSTG